MEYKAFIVKNKDGTVYTAFAETQPEGALSEKESKEFIDQQGKELDLKMKEDFSIQLRVQELQDKAVLEGLTDEEKKEYKELREL